MSTPSLIVARHGSVQKGASTSPAFFGRNGRWVYTAAIKSYTLSGCVIATPYRRHLGQGEVGHSLSVKTRIQSGLNPWISLAETLALAGTQTPKIKCSALVAALESAYFVLLIKT
jgi:hypothetical protein